MARSSVERDLAIMLFQTGGTEILLDRLQQIVGKSGIDGAKDFYEIVNDEQQKFLDASDKLQKAYEELSSILMRYGYTDSNTIINQLASVYSRDEEYSNADIFSIIFDQTDDIISMAIQDKLSKFLDQYDSFFDQMVDSYEFLSSIGEGIRDDKLIYALGTNKSINMVTKEGYAQMLKNEGQMFGLMFNKNGQISGIEMRKGGATRLEAAYKNLTELDKKSVLSSFMDMRINDNSDLTYRQVWLQIRKMDLLSSTLDENGNYMKLNMGRKFELLMSGKFSDLSLDNGDIETQITQIIQSQNKQLSNTENFAGLAGGDTRLFLTNLGRISIQDKFSNRGKGWNGIGFQSIVDAFKFYSTDMKGVIEKMSENPNSQMIESYLNETFYKTSNYEQSLEDQIYTEIGTMWVESMAGDPNLEVWLSDI